ncbi:hypothetical protein HPP92_028976 [Vanilla planifolia]|uniref:Uncharacterized protein n=1 Tax=Vanilla planifolia TaxID=51239 RepID=A0A835U2Q0_VANPL|nr:hypothetical protein HPP92_028976 [Vanilla planifolia]KAG0446176.1 hypothetical protein HPP92_028965 [Vanilla planifolia]
MVRRWSRRRRQAYEGHSVRTHHNYYTESLAASSTLGGSVEADDGQESPYRRVTHGGDRARGAAATRCREREIERV